MSTAVSKAIVNGVDVQRLGDILGAVKDNPPSAGFDFYGEARWNGGAYSETEIKRIKGKNAGEAESVTAFRIPVDEPEALLGTNRAANPVEHILAGLASCLVVGISYNAAARGIVLDDLKVKLEGNLNLEGFLGLREDVRPGYQQIKLEYWVDSKASEKDIEALIAHVEKTSPVLDIIANPVPVKRTLALARGDG